MRTRAIWIAALATLTLTGCTFIERVNVLTNAVNCNVERGDEKAAGGDANVEVLQQSGQGAAQFIGSLSSRIVCMDGTTSEGQVEGSDTQPANTVTP